MMVETMLESSQDFGMSNGVLPQWKRELLQRRAQRTRPAPPPAHPPPPPPPPPTNDDDEELRYGPGIVKRLKSRYLSLALRDAPRRRPSVLRRAASLEHLLDERPPPAPRPPSSRPPRPASVAAPPAALAPPARREIVKRARSVDALSRLDSRDEPHPPSPSPPPPQVPPPLPPPTQPPSPPVIAPPVLHTPPVLDTTPVIHTFPVELSPPVIQAPPPALAPPPHAPPPPPAPRPPIPRAARPPRRPTPLLRETERPPPDVVRSALRKFESAPTRRPAPAARVSAVLRSLDPSRTSTPEPREPPVPAPRSPTPPHLDITPLIFEEPETVATPAEARPVSRAALEGIARAGSSMRFAFEAPKRGSHLPPLAAANQVLLGRARRVGVIRPMPAPTLHSPEPTDLDQKMMSPPPTPRLSSPPPSEPEPSPQPRPERRDPPPAALVDPMPRSPPESETIRTESPIEIISETIEIKQKEETRLKEETKVVEKPLTNGFADLKPRVEDVPSRLGGADIERAWNGSCEKKHILEVKEKKVVETKEVKVGVAPWAGGGGGSPQNVRRPRAPPPSSTSIVFNFSDRKEVPDYIENDGIILRGSRRNRIKPGEPGVVVLRPEALAPGSSDEESECDGPPSPCAVRFLNDNVLINGRSSMPDRRNRDRIAKLKLQFDDSLTRTFEYPSETSLCEEAEEAPPAPAPPGAPAPAPAPAPPGAPAPAQNSHVSHATNSSLTSNTHIVSAALARYTPSKTVADAFQLGVTRHDSAPDLRPETITNGGASAAGADENGEEGAGADARPCCAAPSWSESRAVATDLLF